MLLSFTIKQTSDITGIGRTKLYEVLKSGELQAKKFGKKTIVLRDDLESFLANLAPYSQEEGEDR